MKRIAALLLALCMVLSLSAAQAAPVRDMRRTETEISAGMKMLTETVLGAAVFTGTRSLEENASPSSALAETALVLGLYNLSLPHDGQDLMDNRVSVPAQEANALYHLLFASGEYQASAAPSVSGVSVSAQGLEIDLNVLRDAPMTGVYIYSALQEADGEAVRLAADLYAYYGDFSTDAQDVPEEALTWLYNADIVLGKAPDTAYGYRVKQFTLSDLYGAGVLADWQTYENAACEYSVNVPAVFSLVQDDPEHPVWRTADGSAGMTVAREGLDGRTAAQVLDAFQAANPGREVIREEELGLYYSAAPGDYQLWVILEGHEYAYHVSMQFPAERQAEYTLYSEFIRNSLIVWGISNG